MLLTLPSSRIWIQGNTENIDGLAVSPVYTGDLEGCLMRKQFLGKSGEAFAITATSMAKAAQGARYPPTYTGQQLRKILGGEIS